MKGFSCPNCGKRQSVKLNAPSHISVACPECGKLLCVKMDKGKWSVLVVEEPITALEAQLAG